MTEAALHPPTGRPGTPAGEVAEALWGELAVAAGELNRAHARLVSITARAIESGTWFGVGIKSVEHWLVLRAGLDRGRAGVIVRLARRYDELPATASALSAGQLSLEQAAAVGRHTPARYERAVAELALHATVPQIVRATARYPFEPEPDGEAGADAAGNASPAASEQAHGADDAQGSADAAPERPAALSMGTDAEGRFRLRYDAPAHVGALVEAAIREAKDRLFRERHGDPATAGPAGTYTHQVTLADALAEVCAAAVAAQASPPRRDRYRVLVHLDTTGAWLSGGPRLPQSVLTRLTCDGVLRPVWETHGAPVNVGRGQRVVPERTKALLHDRDRGCRFPGCPQAGHPGPHVEAHHIIHWLLGGRTDTDNLVSLCPWHHDRHHDGDYRIGGNPDLPEHHPGGLRFHTTAGYEIPGDAPVPATSTRPATPASAAPPATRSASTTNTTGTTRTAPTGRIVGAVSTLEPPHPPGRPALRLLSGEAAGPLGTSSTEAPCADVARPTSVGRPDHRPGVALPVDSRACDEQALDHQTPGDPERDHRGYQAERSDPDPRPVPCPAAEHSADADTDAERDASPGISADPTARDAPYRGPSGQQLHPRWVQFSPVDEPSNDPTPQSGLEGRTRQA